MIYYRISKEDADKFQNKLMSDGTMLSIPKDNDGIYYFHEKFLSEISGVDTLEYQPKYPQDPFQNIIPQGNN